MVTLEPLEVYERNGDGHTLRRHCGLAPGDEVRRLEHHPELRATGSFTDRATAQRAVEACVAANHPLVAAWPWGARPRLVIAHAMDEVVGDVLTRAGCARGDVDPQPASGVRVVLQRNPRYTSGFAVLTAYPQLP
jgi:hypothetical protein